MARTRDMHDAPGGRRPNTPGIVNGTNLGNWLVLEKWMKPDLFPAGVDDEIWMHRILSADRLEALLAHHRDTYITEADFKAIAAHGLDLVRIPVPYFVFGDRDGHPGCISHLDKAFDWAERYGLRVLVDLHTVPGSQNGYDNGGLTGVCKWCRNPEEVEFALTVLERLARRYAHRDGLYGIEVLNEPISWMVYVTAPSTGRARDKNEAKGSGHVPLRFLKDFYRDAYRRLRAVLPEDKTIVFHDGFRLGAWKDFFVREGMTNVALDTHIYITAMQMFVPVHAGWVSRLFIAWNRRSIRRAARYTPVMVGEWNIETAQALDAARRVSPADPDSPDGERARRDVYRRNALRQKAAWEESLGHIYWNYKMDGSPTSRALRADNGDSLDAWDLTRVWDHDWMDER